MSSGEPAVYLALQGLLLSLFVDTESLARLFHGLLGATFVDELPATKVSLTEYVHAAVVALDRHGEVDTALFQALVDVRPKRYADICEAADRCGVALECEPPRRTSATPRVRVERALGAIVSQRLPTPLRSVGPPTDRPPNEWLVSGKLPTPRQDNPAALLNARHEMVPFHVWLRAVEFAALQAWCERDDPVALTVVAGPGGVGKTRLMLELCKQARTNQFVTGFVPPHATYEEFAGLFAADARALAIVDYAETRPAIGLWLARAAAITPGAGQRTRVVLVVRSLADWWDMLLERGSSELHALLRRDPPIELNPGALAVEARARVHDEALEFFARVRGVPAVAPSPLDLEAPRFGRVLYLHMAALAAVEGRATAIGSLIGDMLRRERQFWSRDLPTIAVQDDHEQDRLLREIDLGVAALTLAGGANRHDRAVMLLTRAGVASTLQEPLLGRLGNLYPGAGGDATGHAYLSPLEPDLLAEAHVAATLLRKTTPAEFLRRIFTGDRPEDIFAAIHLIGRLASDPGAVVEGSPEHLDRALRVALEELLTTDLEGRAPVALDVAVTLAERQLRCPLAEVMAKLITQRGTSALAGVLALRPISHAVALRPVVEWTLRTVLAAGDGVDHPQRFASLVKLAAVRLNQEDRDGARALIREAVVAADTWLVHHPGALWPSALGIGLLGLTDGEVGEYEAAVEMARESLRSFESIVDDDPDDELEPMRLLLRMMYGLALLRSGARAEAVGEFRAISPRYARLAGLRPGVRIPEQALCDFYLGQGLGEIGHLGEAAVVLRRAVAAQRVLVETQRGSRLADLAWSLLFLCEAEEQIGADVAALAAGREAVGLWEELEGVESEAAMPGLAFALCAVASVMHTLGDSQDARDTATRGVALWRRLAGQRPRVFAAPLVTALLVLATVLGEPGDRLAALAALDEALAVARPLAEGSPGRFAPLVGRCYLLQGLRRAESGDDAAAVDALRDSMAVFRSLPDNGTAGFALERGLAAVMLAAEYGDRDEYAEASAVLSEALAVLARAPGENGSLHAFVLGTAYVLRAMALAGLEDHDAAMQAFAASLAPLRAVQEHHPEVIGFLALALAATAREMAERGDLQACESALLEAIPLWRATIAAGDANADDLADDLILLAQLHHGREEEERARVLLLEAEELLRGLPAEERQEHADELAECLVMLAEMEADPDRRISRLRESAALTAEMFAGCAEEPVTYVDRLVGVAEELLELGLLDEAARILDAAIARASVLLTDGSDDLRMSMTEALEALAEVHVERRASAEFLQALRDAAALWRPHAALLSAEHRTRFAEVLRDLGVALVKLGRRDEANRIAAELHALRPRLR